MSTSTLPRELLAGADILDRVDVGVLVLDAGFRVRVWNRFLSAHSGVVATDILGCSLFEHFPALDERWFRKKVEGIFILKSQAFTTWQQRPWLFPLPHNRPVTGGVEFMYQNCSFMPVKDENGNVESVCITVKDVTDEGFSHLLLQQATRKLEENSRRDGLTGLFNRAYWQQRLEEEMHRSQRYGTASSLLLFDIDHFKRINDTHGHLAGDAVLRDVASLVRDTVRDADIAGRYGGEEFGIILPETDATAAKAAAERLRVRVEQARMAYGEQVIPVTVSIGIAPFEAWQACPEDLISGADQALYQAKQTGRNRCICHPPRP